MSAAAALVAASILLAAAAVRELGASARGPAAGARWKGRRAGSRGRGRGSGWLAALRRLAPDSATRIERAGAWPGLTPAGLDGLRIVGCLAGVGLGAGLSGVAPGRLGLLAAVLLIVGGAIAPDLILERMAARRARQLVASLPDALEALSVGTGAGRSLRAGVAELSRAGSGPLARELGIAAAEIECGRRPAAAIACLRRRVPAPELKAVTLAIERSARLGSPLAGELQRNAASIRDGRRRRMSEQAARAAPKMQLVIAMVLVPSVLLLIAAGLIANAGDLLAGL